MGRALMSEEKERKKVDSKIFDLLVVRLSKGVVNVCVHSRSTPA